METVYSNLYDITELQQKIMRFIDYWVHVEKTPIPQKEIICQMEQRGQKSDAVIYSLRELLKYGYIRRAETISNKTFYVQLRRL